jgi:hypothetical protein
MAQEACFHSRRGRQEMVLHQSGGTGTPFWAWVRVAWTVLPTAQAGIRVDCPAAALLPRHGWLDVLLRQADCVQPVAELPDPVQCRRGAVLAYSILHAIRTREFAQGAAQGAVPAGR